MDDLATGDSAATNAAPASASQGGCTDCSLPDASGGCGSDCNEDANCNAPVAEGDQVARRARCARRVAVGSGERVARTAKQPQGPARGAFAKQKSQEAAQVRCLQGREIAEGGHVVLRSGVTAFFVYATSLLREGMHVSQFRLQARP